MPDIPTPIWLALVAGLFAVLQVWLKNASDRKIKELDIGNKRTADENAAQHAAALAKLNLELEQMRQDSQRKAFAESDDVKIRAELREALHATEAQRDNLSRAYWSLYGECALSLSQSRLVDLSDVAPRPLPNLKPATRVLAPANANQGPEIASDQPGGSINH